MVANMAKKMPNMKVPTMNKKRQNVRKTMTNANMKTPTKNKKTHNMGKTVTNKKIQKTAKKKKRRMHKWIGVMSSRKDGLIFDTVKWVVRFGGGNGFHRFEWQTAKTITTTTTTTTSPCWCVAVRLAKETRAVHVCVAQSLRTLMNFGGFSQLPNTCLLSSTPFHHSAPCQPYSCTSPIRSSAFRLSY